MQDTLQVSLDSLSQRFQSAGRITKRALLSLVASVFDPVGWLSPFVLRGKLLVQRIWAKELRWDDDVPDEVRLLLSTWCEEAQALQRTSLRRQYSGGDSS